MQGTVCGEYEDEPVLSDGAWDLVVDSSSRPHCNVVGFSQVSGLYWETFLIFSRENTQVNYLLK